MVFTLKNIKASFITNGLFLFNADRVLRSGRKHRSSTPEADEGTVDTKRRSQKR